MPCPSLPAESRLFLAIWQWFAGMQVFQASEVSNWGIVAEKADIYS
jgi:hypothetical protein